MPVTDAQVKKMFRELRDHNNLTRAALKAGIDPKTARRYRDAQALPSQLKQTRTWRTRQDPFKEHWDEITALLDIAPEIQTTVLFDELCRRHKDHYQSGQLRTLQRKIRKWRALQGPPKEVFFPQLHTPGDALQTDFTYTEQLRVTIAGEPFSPLLCNSVLPYSNWQRVTISRSESLAALKKGLQRALFKLGRVPVHHQTDNSTAATHSLSSGKREFNDNYLEVMRHFGMKPRTTAVGKPNQNGDVEALNGALKRRLDAHLLLRGSRDFDAIADYQDFIDDIIDRANLLRQERLNEERAVMRPLLAQPLPAFTEKSVRVSSWSTIRLLHNAYSVPARLIGETVRVRLYEEHIQIFFAGVEQLTAPRLLGRNGHRIDYRHIIWSLVRKPAAFARYRFREELFPTTTFRRAYDRLLLHHDTERKADIAYLRLLHLAASTMECEVETAITLLLESNQIPHLARVRALVEEETVAVPELSELKVDLSEYDALLPSHSEVSR